MPRAPTTSSLIGLITATASDFRVDVYVPLSSACLRFPVGNCECAT